MTISRDCDYISDHIYSNSDGVNNNIEIPIVGYEIMEERARFTVSIDITLHKNYVCFFLCRYVEIGLCVLGLLSSTVKSGIG